MIPTITRKQFIDAVEVGITRAGGVLDDVAQRRLRKVAATTPQIAVGTYGEGAACGCPLTRARLTTRYGGLTPLGKRHIQRGEQGMFTLHFDNAVCAAVNDSDYEGTVRIGG